MRPYNDYPSPIVYFPSALYPPVPSTSKQVVGLCRFYYFLFFLDLTNIFRTFHPKTAKDTVFLSAYETFSRIDHIPGHKSDLNKYKKMKTIPCIFSNHNDMKLKVNHKKKLEIPLTHGS